MLRGSVFKYIANLDDVDVEDEVETYEEHCPIGAPVSAQLDPSQEWRAQSVGMGEISDYKRTNLGAQSDLK